MSLLMAPVMWFYDPLQGDWRLICQGVETSWPSHQGHPWSDVLLSEDQSGFFAFLERLQTGSQVEPFIGHLLDPSKGIIHVLWRGQYLQEQQLCCGWLTTLEQAFANPHDMAMSKPHALLINELMQALSSASGLDFFKALIAQLKQWLPAHAIWFGQRVSRQQIKVIASLQGLTEQYALSNTPCQQIYLQKKEWFERFDKAHNNHPWLSHGQRYYGFPLLDKQGNVLAHLAILHNNAIDLIRLHWLLHSLTVRMVAEFQRIDADVQMRLSAVAFETHEGIVITDPKLNILKINKSFSQITGFAPAQVLGYRLEKVLWPNFSLPNHDFNGGHRWQGEAIRAHQQGHSYAQWETITPVLNEQGQISHFVICFEDISLRKAAEHKIHALAYYDDLTGLPNRRQLYETLSNIFIQASYNKIVGALFFIDLDHFKTINDSLGHDVGDWLLKEVTLRLQKHVRKGDCLARLGGDEFVLLLSSLNSNPAQAQVQADLIADRLINEIAAPYSYANQILHISASIGITLFPDKVQSADDLLKQADTAMYQAKSAGRKRRCFFDIAMQQQVDRRLLIHNALRNALNQKELLLYYQPQHQIDSDRLMGAEALIRWQPPERGMVSPAEFIPIAEESDLIVDIGSWVLKEACSQYVRWLAKGIHVPQLSLNVSAKQFHAIDFVERVHETLAITGMDPSCLNFEITESVVLGDTQDAISKMSELKAIGISFAIDDFGVGYSSLRYLKRLPADELKIDRSFIQGLPQDRGNMAIVEAVIAMARHMGFNVTAEGVESRQQLAFLKAQGCHFYQGYLASKPLPVPYFENYIKRLMAASKRGKTYSGGAEASLIK